MNAQEFVRMHQNTPGTTHILTQEKPSGLKAKLTWTDMGWTGCGRAIRRADGVAVDGAAAPLQATQGYGMSQEDDDEEAGAASVQRLYSLLHPSDQV